MIGVESLLFTESRVGVICGVDEAGRGPLFGDVVAAAVILNPSAPIEGLGDSKKLTEKVREKLYDQIYARAISVGVGRASVEEIDQLNILQASMLALHWSLVVVRQWGRIVAARARVRYVHFVAVVDRSRRWFCYNWHLGVLECLAEVCCMRVGHCGVFLPKSPS